MWIFSKSFSGSSHNFFCPPCREFLGCRPCFCIHGSLSEGEFNPSEPRPLRFIGNRPLPCLVRATVYEAWLVTRLRGEVDAPEMPQRGTGLLSVCLGERLGGKVEVEKATAAIRARDAIGHVSNRAWCLFGAPIGGGGWRDEARGLQRRGGVRDPVRAENYFGNGASYLSITKNYLKFAVQIDIYSICRYEHRHVS